MKTIREQMQAYSAYHQNTWNKIIHFLGVPLVTLGLFVPMGWFRFIHAEFPLSGASIFYISVFIYYLRLDWKVALSQSVLTLPLLVLSDLISTMPFLKSLTYFFIIFVGGWIVQLLGHVIEGKRPALADNLLQIFNAPLFITLELMFALGFRHDLKDAVVTQR
jgi:uncharacterized membrane protein YGL010W